MCWGEVECMKLGGKSSEGQRGKDGREGHMDVMKMYAHHKVLKKKRKKKTGKKPLCSFTVFHIIIQFFPRDMKQICKQSVSYRNAFLFIYIHFIAVCILKNSVALVFAHCNE